MKLSGIKIDHLLLTPFMSKRLIIKSVDQRLISGLKRWLDQRGIVLDPSETEQDCSPSRGHEP